MTRRGTAMLAIVLALSGPTAASAQTVAKGDSITATFTIQAIDATARKITLRSEQGEEDTFSVTPEMTRFNELKVGDKVKATYYESMVFQLRKPGEKSIPATADAALSRAKSALPAGTFGVQEKKTVTVKAVDSATPSITVVTEDGRVVTRKIEDKKNIEGVKPGDRIDITYTQALVMNIERSK
jgi:Cu/Ag efflux protein CusF